MLIFLIFLFLGVKSLETGKNENITYCVCESTENLDCSSICQNKHINFSKKAILKRINKNRDKHIIFILCGTSNEIGKMPVLYLENLSNISISFESYSSDKKEHIGLYGGTVHEETNTSFSMVNIHLFEGVHNFGNLELSKTKLSTFDDSDELKLKQYSLVTDFKSLSTIPKNIKHIGPSHGLSLYCSSDVSEFQIFKNHHIVMNSSKGLAATLDLSQMVKGFHALIKVMSRDIKLSFDEVPKMPSDIPFIDFLLLKSSNIFLNSDQFPDEMMVVEKIKFIHGNRILYIHSKTGTLPPTFLYEGNGTKYINDKTRTFYQEYCLCESQCDDICESFHIIPFNTNSIDETVLGNPSKQLKYLIAHSSKEVNEHPIFDLEHFGNRNLTIKGVSYKNEAQYIEFTGDATDDIGFFSISDVIMFGSLFFPHVSLQNTSLLYDNRLINSVSLVIDQTSLNNFAYKNAKIMSPSDALELFLNDSSSNLTITLIRPGKICLNNYINISLDIQTKMSIHTKGDITAFFYILENYAPLVNNVPKIDIYLDGMSNTVSFPGKQWPEALSDISAKITFIHGSSTLNVIGEFDGEKYQTIPPIINNEGTGPIFINKHSRTFQDSYCICEGEKCNTLCKEYGPIVGFSEEQIANTANGNPTEHIDYYIFGSTNENRPFFGLHTFQSKSFTLHNPYNFENFDNKQFVALEGTYKFNEIVSQTISHTFLNIDLLLSNSGAYFFNNLILKNCSVHLNKSVTGFFKIITGGLSTDMNTIINLAKDGISDILTPPHANIYFNGGEELSKIIICNEYNLTMPNINEGINGTLDVSLLKTNPAKLITKYKASKENPFLIIWDSSDETISDADSIPHFNLDVSGVELDDIYIKFTGRKWIGEFNNLTKSIFITFGQKNIHLLPGKDKLGKDTLYPPYVSLNGVGDYYINEEKQPSIFAPRSHDIEVDDQPEKKNGSGFYIVIALLLILLAFISISLYKKYVVNNFGQMRANLSFDIENTINDLPEHKFQDIND